MYNDKYKYRMLEIMAHKRLVSIFLICTIIFSLTSVFATETIPTTTTKVITTLDRANALKELGLFAGTEKALTLKAPQIRHKQLSFF